MNKEIKRLIDLLSKDHTLNKEELLSLLKGLDTEEKEYLYKEADKVRKEIYGNKVYARGLIEFTNYCKNDCFYCGIRKSNRKAERYRLTKEEIIDCCHNGYSLGFRTFVLQGERMAILQMTYW